MKRFSAISALLLPLLPFSQGQYRGPDYEALLGGGYPASSGDTRSGLSLLDSAAVEGFSRWEFWFEINKDVLLRTRNASRIEVIGPKAGMALGVDRVDQDMVEKDILPALREAASSRDTQLARVAIQALGKVGSKDAYPMVEAMLNQGDFESKKLAMLAMGMIDDRKALARLTNLLEKTELDVELRTYAALGIGLRGTAESAPILKSFLERNLTLANATGESRNLLVAAVSAIAMTRNSEAVSLLLTRYKAMESEGRSRARAVLSAMLSALGRLGDASAMETLVAALKSEDTEIRRAAALAIGDIGEKGGVDDLVNALASDADVQVKGFAAISLGRIGGSKAREALREGWTTKKSKSVKSFCAIGLGLAEDQGVAEELRKSLSSSEEDSVLGAVAIGLGFMHDQASVPALLEVMNKRSASPRLRGYAALAIGMIRPDGVMPKMLAALQQDSERLEDFQRGLLLGIGLFKDPAATNELLRVLAEDKRDHLRAHAALALGLSRDRNAVKPLSEILAGKMKSENQGPLYAALALGSLGDRFNYPLVSEAFFNTNYRVRIEILDKLQTLF